MRGANPGVPEVSLHTLQVFYNILDIQQYIEYTIHCLP